MKLQFKKNKRLIIGIPLIALLFMASFKLLPAESQLYLTTDISNLRNSLLPVSILLSLAIVFLLVFYKTEFKGRKWSKSVYIIYLLGMSYAIHNLTSDLLMTIALKSNRLTTTKTINKTFVMSTISTTSNNGEPDFKLWVLMHDDIYEVRGRVANKLYEDDVDSIFMDYDDYMKITYKKEFEFTLQEGLFGIPYNPKVIE